jgi:hypothetical protein
LSSKVFEVTKSEVTIRAEYILAWLEEKTTEFHLFKSS